ncbi:RNase H domain-containing protein [Caerostris darwini]|uniref:RNase H domain-containing protein n=1 Tax=Caerostris darwini TaxID=1538125 RepID=A0AAV4NJN4_9ARAC|nr:RNase H domain-containing protein [Caerostris darwini]
MTAALFKNGGLQYRRWGKKQNQKRNRTSSFFSANYFGVNGNSGSNEVRDYSYQKACSSGGDHFQDIWILTDSRASIRHLSNWGIVGDQTSLDILKLLDLLSPSHTIHFQWIPFDVGVEGNEKADSLAKSAAEEDASHCGTLTFGEISSLAEIKTSKLSKSPPNHSWYFARKPGGSFQLRPRFH